MELLNNVGEYLPQIITVVVTILVIMKQLSPLTELVGRLVKGKADKADLEALYHGMKEIVELEEVRALREVASPVVPDEYKEMYRLLLDKYKDNKTHLDNELERLKD